MNADHFYGTNTISQDQFWICEKYGNMQSICLNVLQESTSFLYRLQPVPLMSETYHLEPFLLSSVSLKHIFDNSLHRSCSEICSFVSLRQSFTDIFFFTRSRFHLDLHVFTDMQLTVPHQDFILCFHKQAWSYHWTLWFLSRKVGEDILNNKFYMQLVHGSLKTRSTTKSLHFWQDIISVQ